MLVRCLLVTFSRQTDVGVYSMPMDMQVLSLMVIMKYINVTLLIQDKTLFSLKTMDGLMLQVYPPVSSALQFLRPIPSANRLRHSEFEGLQGRRPTIIADISGRLLLLLLHIQQPQAQAYPNPFVFALQVRSSIFLIT
jgi:hypothetical protein